MPSQLAQNIMWSLVIKDAFRQILWRVFSAVWGFLVLIIIAPILWDLRYWDYSTILKYFAIWSALADFWMYVLALRQIWEAKAIWPKEESEEYSRFVFVRMITIWIVYWLALLVWYFIPAYTQNPYLIYGLPLWMIFSASFMGAGILQIPLQIHRKMEQVTIALIISRVVQVLFLLWAVWIFYPSFKHWAWNQVLPLSLFLIVLFSVVLSWVAQMAYVYFVWKKYIRLRFIPDFGFLKKMLTWNRKFGLAYFFSSFHTLAVLILMWIFFPTIKWFSYTWNWAMAMGLVELMLIVPSSLWNSLIHRVSGLEKNLKLKKFWALLTLVLWIGWMVSLYFTLLSKEIIMLTGWEKFLTHSASWWAEKILPFLTLVLCLNFVKQVFNYIFVAENKQNSLVFINWFGILAGLSFGLWAIPNFNIQGWVYTQLLLESLFVLGSLWLALKSRILPKIDIKIWIFSILWWIVSYFIGGYIVNYFGDISRNFHWAMIFILQAILIGWIFLAWIFPFAKKVARNLS